METAAGSGDQKQLLCPAKAGTGEGGGPQTGREFIRGFGLGLKGWEAGDSDLSDDRQCGGDQDRGPSMRSERPLPRASPSGRKTKTQNTGE